MDSININFGTASITDSTFAIGKDNRINNIPSNASCLRFLYKGIIINHNKKPSQPTLKRRFFKKKAAFFSWPGLGKEWC